MNWCLLKVQMSFHGKILLTLKTDLIRMTSIGSAKSRNVINWRQNPWQFVYICFCCCLWLGNQLLIHHPVNECWMCRMCHGFRLTNWDDYFRVQFDHYWIKRQFLGSFDNFKLLVAKLCTKIETSLFV